MFLHYVSHMTIVIPHNLSQLLSSPFPPAAKPAAAPFPTPPPYLPREGKEGGS